MEKNNVVERNSLLEQCISEILEGKENLLEVLKKYEGVSLTQLLNYSSRTPDTAKKLTDLAVTYIKDNNPGLDEYLNLFPDESKHKEAKLDAVLLGLDKLAKPYRKTDSLSVLPKLETDMKLMRDCKEKYTEGSRYGILDKDSNQMTFASDEEIANTIEYIKTEHKDAFEKLGYVPSRLITLYVKGYLNNNKEGKSSEQLEHTTPKKAPVSSNREAIMQSIRAKMEKKQKMLKDMADMDKYIEFMEGKSKTREE